MSVHEKLELAMVFDQKSSTITVAPRDGDAQAWLATEHVRLRPAIEELHERWQGRGVGRRDLPVIATDLECDINRRLALRQLDTRVRVRACEYRPVVTHEELVEI